MKGNGNNPNVTLTVPATPEVSRIRASGPILLLAVLFVVGSFLAWYFTWFGRGLSDADISKYLSDYQHPRHVQHALLQVQERIERRDPAVKRWYPQILKLTEHPETEFRLTVAWVMGSDNTSPEFHNALKQLVNDPEPIVRRNAALALVRFNDPSGRAELAAIFQPLPVRSSATGKLVSSLSVGAQISRGSLLARIQQNDQKVIELRSPLAGTIDQILVGNGSDVAPGDTVLLIKSDEQSIWEALRGLAVVGIQEDLHFIEQYAKGTVQTNERIRQQAVLTANAIKARIQS